MALTERLLTTNAPRRSNNTFPVAKGSGGKFGGVAQRPRLIFSSFMSETSRNKYRERNKTYEKMQGLESKKLNDKTSKKYLPKMASKSTR